MGFEPFIKYPVEAYANGEFVFSHVVQPLWWWLGASLVVVAVTASVFRGARTRQWSLPRRGTMALLQVGFVLAVGILLAGPALRISIPVAGANVVAVLVDTSLSMGFPEQAEGGGRSRFEVAMQTIATIQPALAELAEVVLFGFDATAARQEAVGDLQVAGMQTRLLQAVNTVVAGFQDQPLAAVVVITDGADNGPDTEQLAGLSTGVPVHTVGIGPLTLPHEIQLTDVNMPTEVTAGSRVTADVLLEQGAGVEGPVTLKVYDGQRLVAAKAIDLPPNAPTVRTAISFDSGDGGIRELNFTVEGVADSFEANNRTRRLLTVSERRRRVLYLEGEPRWEFKYLRRAVATDDVLQLVSWVRTTDRKTYSQGIDAAAELDGGLPADRATLYRYDVVILGSLAAAELSEQQHLWLESFVSKRGGSLLVLAGRESLADGGWDVQPLADALPVAISRDAGPTYHSIQDPGAVVVPTRDGLLSTLISFPDAVGETLWQSLPALGDLQQLGDNKPAAQTLLELVDGTGKRYPLLVAQPYGLGTTAVMATATTWRWQMRTPPTDLRHRLFWRHLLRQLAESALRPRDLRVAVDTGGDLDIRTSANDADFEPNDKVQVSTTVTGPDGIGVDVPQQHPGATGGVFAGRYATPAAGVYRIDVVLADAAGEETLSRFVRVGSEDVEYANPVQNVALLERLANATGGRYWTPDTAGGITRHIRYAGSGVRSFELLPLWNLPLVFILLLALKLGEWLLRRHWGRI